MQSDLQMRTLWKQSKPTKEQQHASAIKTIKPIINEAFVASSVDIITDYNDLYCLFMHRAA